jgi:transposase
MMMRLNLWLMPDLDILLMCIWGITALWMGSMGALEKVEIMAKVKSWEVSDKFLEKVEPLIPKVRRDPNKEYKRKEGGGRKPLPARQVFEGIIYVLRTGCQWQALPKERFGSPGSVYTYFATWLKAGFFLNLWRSGLTEYDEMRGIAWEW